MKVRPLPRPSVASSPSQAAGFRFCPWSCPSPRPSVWELPAASVPGSWGSVSSQPKGLLLPLPQTLPHSLRGLHPEAHAHLLVPLPRSFPSWEVGCPHLTPHSLRVPTHLAFNTKLRSRRPGELGPEGGSPRTRLSQTSRVRNQACVCWGELGFASGTQPPNTLKRAKTCPGSSTCALRHGARSHGIHTERRTRRAGHSPPSFCCDGTRPLHSDFIVQQVTWPSVTPRDRGVGTSPGRAANTPGQEQGQPRAHSAPPRVAGR